LPNVSKMRRALTNDFTGLLFLMGASLTLRFICLRTLSAFVIPVVAAAGVALRNRLYSADLNLAQSPVFDKSSCAGAYR
jgi:hypothetical protein